MIWLIVLAALLGIFLVFAWRTDPETAKAQGAGYRLPASTRATFGKPSRVGRPWEGGKPHEVPQNSDPPPKY